MNAEGGGGWQFTATQERRNAERRFPFSGRRGGQMGLARNWGDVGKQRYRDPALGVIPLPGRHAAWCKKQAKKCDFLPGGACIVTALALIL